MRKILLGLLLSLVMTAAYPAAYTFRSAGTIAAVGTGAAISPGMPGTCSDGNLLLLLATAAGASETLTVTGYTELATRTTNGSVKLFGRIRESGDSAPSVDWSGTSHAQAQISCWGGDVYTDMGTIVAHSDGANGNTTAFNYAALTISTADTLVIIGGKHTKTATSNGQTVDAEAGFTEIGENSPAGTASSFVWNYVQQTTATNISAGGWDGTVAWESSGYTSLTVSLKTQAAATPTFTSAPAIGTRTTSSIPINATSDTTGTMYGGRLTDGSAAPTCDALEAQTATGGVQYASEAVVATVADTLTFSSITDGTVTDGYFCIEDGSGNDSAVASIADMYKLPAFTTPLTIASQTDTTYTTNSKVLDGPGLVDLVACLKDASPPSVAQVEAGTGGCILSGSEDDATGTMTLNPSGGDLPVYDLYYVGTYGSQHEAAVHALVDECLDAPSGKQLVNCPTGLTSIGAGSPILDLNAAITPDWAVGDILICDAVTDPGAFALTASVAGQFSYSGDDSRQYANCTSYDTSIGAIHADDLDLWFNNQTPLPPEPDSIVYRWTSGQAITPVDFDSTPPCTDVEEDAITVTAVSGLAAGLSLSNNQITGTPTTPGVSTLILRCTDITGASVDWQ